MKRVVPIGLVLGSVLKQAYGLRTPPPPRQLGVWKLYLDFYVSQQRLPPRRRRRNVLKCLAAPPYISLSRQQSSVRSSKCRWCTSFSYWCFLKENAEIMPVSSSFVVDISISMTPAIWFQKKEQVESYKMRIRMGEVLKHKLDLDPCAFCLLRLTEFSELLATSFLKAILWSQFRRQLRESSIPSESSWNEESGSVFGF